MSSDQSWSDWADRNNGDSGSGPGHRHNQCQERRQQMRLVERIMKDCGDLRAKLAQLETEAKQREKDLAYEKKRAADALWRADQKQRTSEELYQKVKNLTETLSNQCKVANEATSKFNAAETKRIELESQLRATTFELKSLQEKAALKEKELRAEVTKLKDAGKRLIEQYGLRGLVRLFSM